jgi:hypothetical protein
MTPINFTAPGQYLRSYLLAILKAIKRLAKLTWEFLRKPVPGTETLPRWGIYPPVVIAALTYTAWKVFDFLPGYCIAVLAFSALFMTVRADQAENFSVVERFLWVTLGAFLLWGEIHVLRDDREKNDREQASERESSQQRFQRTADSLTAVLQSQESMLRQLISSNKLATRNLAKAEEAINTETGGDAFCYVDFAPPLPQTGSLSAFDQTWMSVFKVGQFPVYGVTLLILDNEKANYLIQHDSMPVEQQRTAALTNQLVGNLGNEATSVGGYSVVRSENHDFQVLISSFHAFSWSENFSMRKVGGKWKTALFIDVSGTHPATRGYYRIDDGYPLRDDGSPDNGWRWPFNRGDGKWIRKLPPHL